MKHIITFTILSKIFEALWPQYATSELMKKLWFQRGSVMGGLAEKVMYLIFKAGPYCGCKLKSAIYNHRTV